MGCRPLPQVTEDTAPGSYSGVKKKKGLGLLPNRSLLSWEWIA